METKFESQKLAMERLELKDSLMLRGDTVTALKKVYDIEQLLNYLKFLLKNKIERISLYLTAFII